MYIQISLIVHLASWEFFWAGQSVDFTCAFIFNGKSVRGLMGRSLWFQRLDAM